MSEPSNTMGIGTIGNYYGNLCVANDDEGRFFWSIEDHDGCEWEEIPKSLYDELVRFENTRNRPVINLTLCDGVLTFPDGTTVSGVTEEILRKGLSR